MSANLEKAERFTRALARAGVPRDGVLLVHSAFRGFSRDGHDADATVDALAEYMDPGTILFPTMSWRFVKAHTPFFDELATPSNTGILTERFRVRLATRRSIHPTHSVSGRGALVDELLSGHHLDETPCSARSPFGRLAAADGWVAMLGISMDCATLIHHAEELVAPELYLHPPEKMERYTCRDRHGQEWGVGLRRHLFLPRDYWQFQDRLAAQGQFFVQQVDGTVCRFYRARELVETVLAVLRREPGAVLAKSGQRYRMM